MNFAELCLRTLLCQSLLWSPLAALAENNTRPQSPASTLKTQTFDEALEKKLSEEMSSWQDSRTLADLLERHSDDLSDQAQLDLKYLIKKYDLKEFPRLQVRKTNVHTKIQGKDYVLKLADVSKGRVYINDKLVILIQGQSFKVTVDSFYRAVMDSKEWDLSQLILPQAEAFAIVVFALVGAAALALVAFKAWGWADELLYPDITTAQKHCKLTSEIINRDTQSKDCGWFTRDSMSNIRSWDQSFNPRCYCPGESDRATDCRQPQGLQTLTGQIDDKSCKMAKEAKVCLQKVHQLAREKFSNFRTPCPRAGGPDQPNPFSNGQRQK